MIALRQFAPLLLLIALSSGCQSVRPTSTTTAPATTGPTQDRAIPTATLAASFQGPSLLQDSQGRWLAAGTINNDSDHPVEDLQIQIEFIDAAGERLITTHTTPVPAVLAAGGRAHFSGALERQGQVVSAQAELLSYVPAQATPMPIDFRLEAILPSNDGGSRVIGYLTNGGRSTLNLTDFSIIARQAAETLGLPQRTIIPQQIPANSELPWQAEFHQRFSSQQLEILTGGLPATDQTNCPLTIELEPGLQLDPQDKPFYSGQIISQSNSVCQLRLLLLLKANRKVVELISMRSAIPLMPNEIRPFGFRFEPIAAGQPASAYSLEAFPETSPSPAAEQVHLELQVTSFEVLGSNLFLQGQVTNPSDQSVFDSELFAAARATDGRLLTAAWQALPPAMEAGTSHAFVLALPVGEDMELGTAEFDVRAIGLSQER